MAIVAVAECELEFGILKNLYSCSVTIITAVIIIYGGNKSDHGLAVFLIIVVIGYYGLAVVAFMAVMLHDELWQ